MQAKEQETTKKKLDDLQKEYSSLDFRETKNASRQFKLESNK